MEEKDTLIQNADLDAGPGADIPPEVLEKAREAAEKEDNANE